MTFWILITLFSILAMVSVFYPMLARRVDVVDPFDEAQNLYEARIVELDRDLELGRLDKNDVAAAKAELGRNLIKLKQGAESKAVKATAFSKPGFIISSLFVPLLGLGIYFSLGTPQTVVDLPVLFAEEENADEQPSIETLLAAAEKQLSENPDDLAGWTAIAPVYMRLQQFDRGIEAYRNILRIEGRNPNTVFTLGEAIMAKGNGIVSPEALELFQETVELAPDNAIAHFYIGVQSMQNGDSPAAIAKWQSMVDGAEGDEQWLPTIKTRIAELQAQMAAEENEVSDDSEAAEQLEMINGMVSNLEQKLSDEPDDKEGWEMLIRSYMVLERPQDALKALETAKTHFNDDQSFLSRLNTVKQSITSTIETGSESGSNQ